MSPAATAVALGLIGRHDLDPLLGRGRDPGAHGFGERRVVGDPSVETGQQAAEQDRADEGRSERGAEILRGALESTGLVGLLGWRRRHDHVAQLGHHQTGAHAEQRERELEPRVVQLDVDRANEYE